MSDLFLTSGYSLTHPSGGPTFGVHRRIRYGVDAKNALTNASTRIDNSSSIHAIRLREALSSSCFGL